MKIYLAGGFSVSNIKGRERKLASMFSPWRRLYTYFWKVYIYNSEILLIKADENKKKRITKRTKTGATRTRNR